jgi:hypothetical protein
MRKKIIIIVLIALAVGLIYGLNEYFRKPKNALDQKVEVLTFSESLGTLVDNGSLLPGAIVKVSGEIISYESESVELIGGVLVSKSTMDTASWPQSGSASFQAKFDGVEEDDFFGEIIYRLSGGFLLKNVQPEHLNQTNSEE